MNLLNIFCKKFVHEGLLAIQEEICIEAHSKAKLISLKLDAVTQLNRSFLGINIQYIIDDHIKLKTLSLVELTQSHTGSIIYCHKYNLKNY